MTWFERAGRRVEIGTVPGYTPTKFLVEKPVECQNSRTTMFVLFALGSIYFATLSLKSVEITELVNARLVVS